MNKIRAFSFSAILLFAAACTEPVEMNTTQIAAATGGVIGAGLGAIIGSQTGDAGAGVAIGAAAGVASGALIGDSIYAQEETLRNQDEALERQERTIAAQKSELEELRRMNQDTPGFKSRLNNSLGNQNIRSQNTAYSATAKNPAGMNKAGTYGRASMGNGGVRAASPAYVKPASVNNIRERSIQPQIPVANSQPDTYSSAIFSDTTKEVSQVSARKQIEPELVVDRTQSEVVALPAVSAVNSDTISGNSTECQQAAAEISKSKLASDTSDKLFHTRRAIRLCPQMPSYHQSLGEVYLSLSRKDDAMFEFEEALKYDPTYAPAIEASAKLSSKGKAVSNTNKY